MGREKRQKGRISEERVREGERERERALAERES